MWFGLRGCCYVLLEEHWVAGPFLSQYYPRLEARLGNASCVGKKVQSELVAFVPGSFAQILDGSTAEILIGSQGEEWEASLLISIAAG